MVLLSFITSSQLSFIAILGRVFFIEGKIGASYFYSEFHPTILMARLPYSD